MKNKIVTVAAFFAVMIAMTGIAAADQMNVYKTNTNDKVASIPIPLGGEVKLDLVISAFLNKADTLHNTSVEVLDTTGKPTTGLQVTIDEKTGHGPKPSGIFPSDNPIVIWKQDMGAGGSEKLNLKIKDVGKTKKEFIVRIEDSAAGVQLSKVTVGAEVTPTPTAAPTAIVTPVPTSVPEFPAVALPMAAIIGLVFLVQHRRKEKN